MLPSRADLARVLSHYIQNGGRLQGASDHLVSEALYLADPEGNGIELYRDRPREEWIRDAGGIRMATDPLDVEALLAEGGASSRASGPACRKAQRMVPRPFYVSPKSQLPSVSIAMSSGSI